MRITTKCKIATDALLEIAAHTEKGYAISLPIVSKRLAVSHSYLELIFSSLKAAGLIRSHRGPGGGYSLAKELGAISVKDIVDATGESPSLEGDPSAQLWVNLDAHMQKQMAQITLSHLLARTAIPIEPSLTRLHLRLEKASKSKATKASAEKRSNKIRKPTGPNSVFSFGKYLLHKQ
ncbi:Rrf2 family transcriptional regulator [Polynucleobacter sp. AM-25C3]|jgi:Rrf2 family iron-sulfur cluster assembly transcriptional regulator|uniref:RrF2 family transcriptional regulator n=1 Tax=Polynucleobacter sp. AM-25C3 TaxID=1855569 RepID=UPI001C0BB821|nr:Rrf2 family transcriptional regulator [Polynucleobacter sp. AM-25C3]MBU3602290.1 Rrf2 family transcriptional regulator [Polynucleobacter sp. AM-25C3]